MSYVSPVSEALPEPEEDFTQYRPEEIDMSQADPNTNTVDPTQTLFSALGRFCRHFTRAQSMPNSAWPEDCMMELTTSLKVSLDQGWTNLQRALIDTARILRSYEHAGRSPECLPFLQKSHDILSLMVGDLILDRVADLSRYGWIEHFDAAVKTLKSAGVPLIDDNAPTATPAAPAPVPSPAPAFTPMAAAPAPVAEPQPVSWSSPQPVAASVAPPPITAPAPAPAVVEIEEPVAVEAEPEPEPVAEAIPIPVEETPVIPEDDSVESLNAAMQKAILTGDVATAKILAIKLAASLGRRETDHAIDELNAAEDRLSKNGRDIDAGQRRVVEAETRLEHFEQEIAERKAESEACQNRIEGLEKDIEQRRSELADLEAQIRALQEKRAEASAALHDRESERSAALAGDSLIRTEIESLSLQESEAKGILDEERTRLELMQADKVRIEEEIASIELVVDRRRKYVVEIERPLKSDQENATEDDAGADTESRPNGEMLF